MFVRDGAPMSEWVFLSGPMGSGKSTVGAAIAERRSGRFVDLDTEIEREAGESIPSIFSTRGEEAFRALEAEVLRRTLEGAPAVVALGGGTVVGQSARRELLGRGVLLTLRADVETLQRRIGSGSGRPLAGRLAELLQERAGAYAECHALIDTEAREVAEVVARVERVLANPPVVVPLGTRTYRVALAPLAELASVVAELAPTGVLVVTDENVEPWARRVAASLSGVRGSVVLEPGEDQKTIAAIDRIWDAALDAGIDRGGLLVAVGGGVVGDLAGFAASTLMRGVDLVQVPTTTLAMVDASVGGKTGFDRRQGKNLVGTFHQPRHVLVDVDTLSTLPDPELRSGFAEVVKSAWLDGERAVAALERNAEALLARDPAALADAVRRSVALKARVVARDEREGAHRMILNLGHTMGHAIEAAQGYRVRHGEAVALGMIAAFRVAARLGDTRAAEHEARVSALLRRLGLPVDVDSAWDVAAASFVTADKKRRGGRIRFVVPGAPGEVRVVPLDASEIRP